MPSSHIDLVRANFSRRVNIQGELREIDEAATTDERSYTETEESRIAELRSELESIDGRITANLELEQRSAEIHGGIEQMLGAIVDQRSGEVFDERSFAEQFVQSDEFRSWAERGGQGSSFPSFTGDLDYRAVTDTTTGATSGGAFISPSRLSRVGQTDLDRRVFLTDLLPRIPVANGAAEYVRDVSPMADMANKAAETAEAGGKPQAGITLEVVQEPTPTIAAWVNLTRQVAADAPQVQAYLEGRLRYSLRRRLDGQVIAGSGLNNIVGLANRANIGTHSAVSGEAIYASIRKGITVMEEREAVGEIIVLHPSDAETFDLSNDTAAGLHAVPNVAGPGARTAWGLTQVRSTAVAAGTALIIDPMATAILDRQAPTAYLTDSHASNFTSNILTLLLELRAGVALFDADGVCLVTFDSES